MWMARYFPGTGLGDIHALDELTPEQQTVLAKAGAVILKSEGEERVLHTKVIARAAGMRF